MAAVIGCNEVEGGNALLVAAEYKPLTLRIETAPRFVRLGWAGVNGARFWLTAKAA